MVRDIQQLASSVKWDPKAWTDFLSRFDVTSEMFMAANDEYIAHSILVSRICFFCG